MNNPNKRVTLKATMPIYDSNGKVVQTPGELVRTTRTLADKLIKAGKHVPTTKSKLKAYLRKQGIHKIPAVHVNG